MRGLRSHSSSVATPSAGEVYVFDGVRVDVTRHVVSRDGQPIALAPKTFELLLILVRSNGRVLTRQELVAALWPDTFVEEANLTFQISSLRRALGEGAEQWVETVPRVGYRFTPDMSNESTIPPGPSAAVHDAETTCLEPPFRREPLSRRKLAVAAAVSLGLVVLTGAGLAWRVSSARATATVDERRLSVRSIAVLPFEDLSAGKGDVQYADGLTEALIAELSTLDGLDKVIGRQSVARFRTSPVPLRDAARALGVDAIVTAALLRSAGRLRVTARLVDGATERHLWAATYERPDGEVLLIQREIVEAIAGAVQLALGPEALARMPRARAVAVAAFDAYIAGRQAVNAGPLNSVQAIAQFTKATALDPEFAPAHAALANVFWHSSMAGTAAPEVFRKGKAAAARALSLDPNLGEAHAASGLLALHGDWDWAAADASLRRAVRLTPNSAMVRGARVHYLVLAARYDEAIDESRRAVELDPSPNFIGSLAWASFHARQYDESARRWRQANVLGFEPVFRGIAVLALAMAGRADEVRTYCPATATGPLAWRCAQGHALLGDPAPARLALATAPADSALLLLAEMHAALADPLGAVRALERAYDAHDAAVLFMNSPLFDLVRHDVSFRSLQRRVKYPLLAEGDGRISPALP